ncbi:MAG: DUF885 domain-containing protein [Gemmatimonadales bacterium]
MSPRQLLLPCLALLVACAKPAPPDRNADWDAFRDKFLESHLAANPTFAVYQGRHEFDGKFPDWSEAGIKTEIARLKTARDSAQAFPAEALDSVRRFERDYLLAVVDQSLFWTESADAPHKNPDFYIGFFMLGPGVSPDVYLTRPYAPLPDRMRAYINWAKGIPAVLTQVKTNLHAPLARPLIDIGRTRYGGLAAYLKDDLPGVFTSITDTALQGEFRTANAAAAAAFVDLDNWLETQRATQTENFALGPKLFAEMLRATERVDVPLERLTQVGREDMARNVASLKEACAAFAPGKSIPECMAKMNAHKPKVGPVAEATEQLDTLQAFLRAKDLVTIPGTETAQVHESPPYQRANSAYIDIPGPFEKGLPSIYYIAPADPKWSKAEQASYIPGVKDLLFTSVHEVWPGHFLQFLHANRAPSRVGQLFVGYAFSEGWAHYSEEMMWEAGLGAGDPETHIGQLSNALLRNARYLSAIGLHSGTMTVAESEKLFREEAFQDAATARQQAARGTYDPAYLNYTLGKLMIRKLREDWTATHGGKTSWKAFHDAFLNFGGPPVPLVRAAMLGANGGPAL